MSSLPTGTVTFLFTDIEGSTRLLQQLGGFYADVLAQYRRLVLNAVQEKRGQEIDTQGDACFAVFPSARDGLAAAVAAQKAIATYRWPQGATLRIRMGLHTGEAQTAGAEYVGMDVHRAARICACGHGGQILVSDATRAIVADEMPPDVSLRDLGEHRLKDLARPTHLFQVVALHLPVDFPPLKSLDVLPNNLPRQLTTFIGRDREIEEVKRLIASTALLTITGAGGSGKTRLALQVAADVLEQYPDGIWFVELAPVSDPAFLQQTVTSALCVPEQPGRSLTDTLVDYLRPKSVLLLLDNCEHLRAACVQLAGALLQACPSLRILTTSRERLNLAGELTYRVPSLAVPDSSDLLSRDKIIQCEAVRLFVERATFVHQKFEVTHKNAPALAQICMHLDGIPLAIELAAARVNVLAVEQIARRLDDRFRLLTRTSPTTLPRHQTLQAAMDWSYGLLSEAERLVLRRFSVFAGGWTLEACEAVCPGNDVQASDILDFLTQLVDKSLVVAETQDGEEVRFRLLETVRQYAREKLVESGESTCVRRRHRDWYLGLAERAETQLKGLGQQVWLDRLQTEHGNLRAALEWSLENGDAESGLRLASALWMFWLTRSLGEGRIWLEEMLKKNQRAPLALRAKAVFIAGNLAMNLSDYGGARPLLIESLMMQREVGNKEGTIYPLINLGIISWNQADYTDACTSLEESLAISREFGNKQTIALALGCLGLVAMDQGDNRRSRALAEESLSMRRELGENRSIAEALHNLGSVAFRQGNYVEARSLMQEGLTMRQKLGHKAGIADSLIDLGLVVLHQGDPATAGALLQESLTISQEIGHKLRIAESLVNLGMLALHHGDHAASRTRLEKSLTLFSELDAKRHCLISLEALARLALVQGQMTRAAHLLGAAQARREATGSPLSPSEHANYEGTLTSIQTKLGSEEFTSAWVEGRAMTLEQAIEYALASGRPSGTV